MIHLILPSAKGTQLLLFDMLTLDVQDLETGTSALEDEGLEMEPTTLECYPDLVGSLNRKLTCKWE